MLNAYLNETKCSFPFVGLEVLTAVVMYVPIFWEQTFGRWLGTCYALVSCSANFLT
jgi:hypothetical protein